MLRDVCNYVKSCHICQKVNDRIGKIRAELHPVPVPMEVWKQIGIDMIGTSLTIRSSYNV